MSVPKSYPRRHFLGQSAGLLIVSAAEAAGLAPRDALSVKSLAAQVGESGSRREAETGFFRPAPDQAAKYDEARTYPHGRLFPFSSYAGRTPHSTMRGPYLSDPESLAGIHAEGLKAVVSVGAPKDEVTGRAKDARSVDELVDAVREKVKAWLEADKDETIAWWYLVPEELRYWRKREIEYLEKAARAIRELDPLKRPVWMYDPGHRDAAGLSYTARHLGIVGKGMYTNYAGMKDSRVWCRWTIEQEIAAIARANPRAVPIAVPEMFQQPIDEDLQLIPAWVRHDVYLALVSGAKGVVVFSFWARPKFPAHGDYYRSYVRIAEELNGPQNLGQVFLFGERRNDITLEVQEGPATVEMTYRKVKKKEYASVSLANIAVGSERYVFLVNSANDGVHVDIEGLPAAGARAANVFAEAGHTDLTSRPLGLKLKPLEVRALRISPVNEERQEGKAEQRSFVRPR
jgi:hypothetical protein